MWFAEDANNSIEQITTSGIVSENPIPTANAYPEGLAIGSDGNIWFTDDNGDNIGQLILQTPATTPIITSPANLQINARDQTNFTVTTTGTPSPTLTETDTLPSGLTFTDNGDGTGSITGTPVSGSDGIYTTPITATNTQGSSTSSFTIKVKG